MMSVQNYGDKLCSYAKRKSANVLVIGHGGHSATKLKRVSSQPKLGTHTTLHRASAYLPRGIGGHVAQPASHVAHSQPASQPRGIASRLLLCCV